MSLDYEKCTTAELCNSFEERSGITLSDRQLQIIWHDGIVYPLIDRLREMDKKRNFPRFRELPPELRLFVYEALLVAEETDEPASISTLHPAILRTSRQVYSEALPVLYKQNRFRAKIQHTGAESRKLGMPIECFLMIMRPGGGSSFCQRTGISGTSLLRRLFEDRTMGMLRKLTHLTVDLTDFITPEKQRSSECILQACFAIRALCLSLTGASKLEELTIEARIRSPQGSSSQRKDFDLACALWPLLFLRTDIVVKFEGISAVTDTGLGQSVDAHKIQEEDLCLARRIAQVRRLCSAEVDKRGWAFHRMEHFERALITLTCFGMQRIRLYDTLNLSAVWRGIQGEADRMEALHSNQ